MRLIFGSQDCRQHHQLRWKNNCKLLQNVLLATQCTAAGFPIDL